MVVFFSLHDYVKRTMSSQNLSADTNEINRVEKLKSYEVLNASAEKQFDEIVNMASVVCETPIAFISFLDDEDQWLKAKIGVDIERTARQDSFCQHTLHRTEILEVEDTTKSDLFKEHPYVLNEPFIRFYAGSPIIDESGFNLGSVCVMDIKSRKLNDIQRKTLKSLSQQVSTLLSMRKQSIELQLARELAEHNSKLKSDFLSTMSHEIRTPLNGIISITHLLTAENNTSSRYKDYFRNLRFASEGLLNLVNDILDFSKIEAGKIELNYETFNLCSFLEDVGHTFKFKAEENNTNIKLEWDEKLPNLIKGDKFRLAQVLNNLISNAVKFTEKGTIVLRAGKIHSTEGRVKVLIEVQDSGIGIPEDKLDFVFESFSQASRATSKIYGGTGLGLTITKSLLELFNSKIQVTSKEGEGSCFFFEIEFDIAKEGGKESAFESGKKDISGLTVLLAEDNELNAFVVQRFMDLWKVNLDIVENGKEAVEHALNNSYDIILMDIEMPEMGGREASKLIRESKSKNCQVPIYAMTAYAVKDIDELPESHYFSGYLSKPLNPGQLYDTLSAEFKS